MINILYSGNSKVFDGVLTSLLSIMKYSKEPIKVYIYTMDVSHIKKDYTAIDDKMINFLNEVVKKQNPKNSVIKVDVSEIYKKEFAGCPNEMAYCSPYTLLRLFADKIDGTPDKLLYLDIDIMFHKDIKLLYDTDIENYEYAAARDFYGSKTINRNYINAGVLLFNMKKMKETHLLEKARHLIKTKKMLFADQDALYRSTTKKLMLSQRCNDQMKLHKDTIVRHFSKRLYFVPYPHVENIKQWNVTRVHEVVKCFAFDDILYEYIYLKKFYENNYKNDQKQTLHKEEKNLKNKSEITK